MKPEELYFAESYFPFDQYVLDSYNPDTVGALERFVIGINRRNW